jgi:hypothetical protein
MSVFISYRRKDTAHFTSRLFERLARAFGSDSVRMDVETQPLGTDFRAWIDRAIEPRSTLLVVIGNQWLSLRDAEGVRVIDKPDDPVSEEIMFALERDVRVVPIVCDAARFPRPDDLPQALAPLATRNGLEIRADPHFHKDVDILIEMLAFTPYWLYTGPSSLVKTSSQDIAVTQSEAALLNRLRECAVSWYNEVVNVGATILASKTRAEEHAIKYSYLHTRNFLPEVVAIRDVLGQRQGMEEVVAATNAFLDCLTIEREHEGATARYCTPMNWMRPFENDTAEEFFRRRRPFNPLDPLAARLQDIVGLIVARASQGA